MRDGKVVIVGVLGVLLGLLLGASATLWLLRAPSPTPRAKSTFYSACRDWSAVVQKSIPGNEVVLKNKSPAAEPSSGGTHTRLHHTSFMSWDVTANSDGINKFMRALQTELRMLAQQTGAQIDGGSESTAGHSTPEGKVVDDYLANFDIEYTAGNAFGQVQAGLDAAGKGPPDNAGVQTYKLSVRIEEWVP
jgi:hypothetical protein